MNKFALIEVKELIGKLKIYKLSVNGTCYYDEFENQIKKEGNLASELITIQVRLQEVAECKLLPDNKFKDITPQKESVKEYEIKTKRLRVYLFHDEKKGRIIVCAGKKTRQKKT